MKKNILSFICVFVFVTSSLSCSEITTNNNLSESERIAYGVRGLLSLGSLTLSLTSSLQEFAEDEGVTSGSVTFSQADPAIIDCPSSGQISLVGEYSYEFSAGSFQLGTVDLTVSLQDCAFEVTTPQLSDGSCAYTDTLDGSYFLVGSFSPSDNSLSASSTNELQVTHNDEIIDLVPDLEISDDEFSGIIRVDGVIVNFNNINTGDVSVGQICD